METIKNKLIVLVFALTLITASVYAIDLTDPYGSASITGTSYVNNMNVSWKINTGQSKRVILNYYVNTENNYDYVRIYQLDNNGVRVGNALLEACGTKSGTIITNLANGRAEIVFTSDGSVNGANGLWGFSVDYDMDNSLFVPGNLDVTQNAYINGNVEVGTGSQYSSSSLLVNGTIKAWELTITESGWADYVFDENYKLPSLKSVEQHIQTNGHLPEIPSATEVKANGINLADIQVKLLQKIEELTLYVIKQQKEIEELKRLKAVSALK